MSSVRHLIDGKVTDEVLEVIRAHTQPGVRLQIHSLFFERPRDPPNQRVRGLVVGQIRGDLEGARQ